MTVPLGSVAVQDKANPFSAFPSPLSAEPRSTSLFLCPSMLCYSSPFLCLSAHISSIASQFRANPLLFFAHRRYSIPAPLLTVLFLCTAMLRRSVAPRFCSSLFRCFSLPIFTIPSQVCSAQVLSVAFSTHGVLPSEIFIKQHINVFRFFFCQRYAFRHFRVVG